METVTLNVSGMACGGCSGTVRQALLALDGVIAAEVSHVDAHAVVSYDPDKITLARLEEAVRAAGYTVAST